MARQKRTTTALSSRTTARRAPTREVRVLSDSTGNLARHMLGAFLTQFPPGALTVRFETFIRTPEQLLDALTRARQEGAAICYAMVSADSRRSIAAFCKRARLPCHDLTGGAVAFLAQATGVRPADDVGALHRLDAAYDRRIGAMEFAMNHDDGLGLSTLHEADLVLVGTSRTGKTPTSIYLAQQGYRVANVSLAYGIDPPAELLAMPPAKVVGLTINPEQLAMIRTRRKADWGMTAGTYGDPEHVAREVAWTRRLFRDRGWRVLDVTDQAIEETAARIITGREQLVA